MIVWKLFPFHSVHWGITTPSFLPSTSLTFANCPSHLFRQFPSIGFLWPPLKFRFFSEPPKYPSLTRSYLLKVTKFFVKSAPPPSPPFENLEFGRRFNHPSKEEGWCTLWLCKKTYLLMSPQGQHPPPPPYHA